MFLICVADIARSRPVVGLARELKRVLRREKAFEILGNAFEKMAVEGIKQMTKHYPAKNFNDFIAF